MDATTLLRNSTSDDAAASSDSSAQLSHNNYGPQINVTIWFLAALSSLFLALRIYCKALRKRGLWWDDHVLIASWLALVAQCAFVSVTIPLGLGRPIWDFNSDNLEDFLLFSNLAGTAAILAAAWSKTSFAITVLRISDGWIKRFVWFIIVSVNVALGLSIAFTWGQCTPFEKVWKPLIPGTCWFKTPVIRYNIFTAAYSGAMDMVLAIIPWRIIWSLTINKKEKFGVLFAMSMGVFAGVTSMVKITSLPGIASTDFTDSNTQIVILAAAESAITIIAASIPVLRTLLLRNPGFAPAPTSFLYRYEPSAVADPASYAARSVARTPRGSCMSSTFDVRGAHEGRGGSWGGKEGELEDGYEKRAAV